MFAMNHAATALLLKRRYPELAIAPLLLSVQFMELVWVLLNFLGIELTTTDAVVRDVGDIHLAYMPFSHSVVTMVGAAVLAALIGKMVGRPRLGVAFGLGILSHLILDLVTHNGDIPLAPVADTPKYGMYLYAQLPAVAFALELGFGVFCWWIFRGNGLLLAIVIAFNLANLSLFFAEIPGPEQMLAGRPLVLVAVILAQIVVTLALVGWAATRRTTATSV
ncbi:MAG: metal-dependent hydrolase [Gemmatimonadota bacterium]|nr:metal-dependent hydrolase [Gemmatimonadota bacterium]